MAQTHRAKPDTQDESPVERAFRHGNVKRDAVLMVLDTSMSDAEKVAYLRAWVTDTPLPTQAQPVASRPASQQQDWSKLPAYSLLASSPRVGVVS